MSFFLSGFSGVEIINYAVCEKKCEKIEENVWICKNWLYLCDIKMILPITPALKFIKHILKP